MNINDFLAIGIIGIALSLLIEIIQRKFGLGSAKSRGLAVGSALIVGSIYYVISQTPWFADVVGVLTSASTVYAMFFSGSKPQIQPEG